MIFFRSQIAFPNSEDKVTGCLIKYEILVKRLENFLQLNMKTYFGI